MRNRFSQSALVMLVLIAFSTSGAAQINGRGGASLKLNNDPGGPAPPHELDGTWVGPTDARVFTEAPQFTPLGAQRFKLNKPESAFAVSDTNDPFARNCDPVGFPRNTLLELRGVPVGELFPMTFASLPGRVLVLFQFQQTWRQIWLDGRSVPTDVGSRQKDAPDLRYNGYSVGHWQADNVLVVDTAGLDDSTWLNRAGYPHSAEAHIQERYTRSDHNDLQLTMTVDDPKFYVKPFVLATIHLKWLPDQSLDQGEWLCIPSQLNDYLKIIGDRAN